MRYLIKASLVAFVVAFSCIAGFAQSGTCHGLNLGPGASLNGFVPFQSSSLWNTDISALPADTNSDNIITYIGSTATLHPDFGAGLYQGQTIGIPYQVESASQPLVRVALGAYPDESDPGPMPIPSNALVEGRKQDTFGPKGPPSPCRSKGSPPAPPPTAQYQPP
jgi:hypothetical protein